MKYSYYKANVKKSVGISDRRSCIAVLLAEAIALDVGASHTIKMLKQKFKIKKVSTRSTATYFPGKQLEDSRTLTDYNIQKEKHVSLVNMPLLYN